MPNIQVQFRRGTTTEHSSFAGAEGEVTVDTDLDTLMVHTGNGAGTGVRLAKHSEIPTGGGGTVTEVDTGTGLTGGPITGTGTISIDAGGVGTTELANSAVTTDKIGLRAVTFEKVQLVGNMTVLGNVSGSPASPSSVTILDEDAMGTNSATALATQQSIKAYVDSQVSAGTVSKWDSGWVSQDDQTTPVSVGSGATMVFDHDLGNAAVGSVFSVYAAEDANGTDMESQDFVFWEDTAGTDIPRGIQVQSITSTQVTVQLGTAGYEVTGAGSYGSKLWGTGTNQLSHIRVVLVG